MFCYVGQQSTTTSQFDHPSDLEKITTKIMGATIQEKNKASGHSRYVLALQDGGLLSKLSIQHGLDTIQICHQDLSERVRLYVQVDLPISLESDIRTSNVVSNHDVVEL